MQMSMEILAQLIKPYAHLVVLNPKESHVQYLEIRRGPKLWVQKSSLDQSLSISDSYHICDISEFPVGTEIAAHQSGFL